MAAEQATPQAINFMASHGRGLICVSLTSKRFRELRIPMMVVENTALHATAFGVSVDLKGPKRTGISAFDRAATVQALCDPQTKPPDLARLAGMNAAGVLCEVLDTDGSMARLPRLEAFARAHDLKIITIADLIDYRRRREKLIRRDIFKPRLVPT